MCSYQKIFKMASNVMKYASFTGSSIMTHNKIYQIIQYEFGDDLQLNISM